MGGQPIFVWSSMPRALTYIGLLLYAGVAVWDLAVGFLPRAEASVAVPAEEVEEREAHLLFVGDVMAHYPQVASAQTGVESYDFTPHFEGVREAFEEADYVVGNLETTLSPRPPYGGYPAFSTPEELARDMREVGFDAVTLANNHALDRGTAGVLNTLAALENVGIESVGVCVPRYNEGRTEPLVVDVEGFRVALLAYTFGTNGIRNAEVEVGRIDTVAMREQIEMVRGEVDCLIALMHWGEEYSRRPSGEQMRLSEWMRDEGVDVIVGSHPHVVQPVEEWRDESGDVVGGVFYSLGNFISNQNSPHTDYGLVANVHLRSRGLEPCEITLSADTVRRIRTLDGDKFRYALRVE